MKETIENNIRFKAILMYVIIALACAIMIAYVYKMRKNVASQRTQVERYYDALALTGELVYMVNQAQSESNLYVSTKNSLHLNRFRENMVEVGHLVDSFKLISSQANQQNMLGAILPLLKEKERIITALSVQLDKQNPLDLMNSQLKAYDSLFLARPVTVTTIVKDTAVNTAPKKGFWTRVSNVFSPDKTGDTIVTVRTQIADTLKFISAEEQNIVSEMGKYADTARKRYSKSITAIERQLSRLISTDQEISLQISTILNNHYSQTLKSALAGIQSSEELIKRNYAFSIIGGVVALALMLMFILLIIHDVNKGQAARRALEQANVRTKQLMESRHKLLLSVSHDIKTPLGSILGYLELWQSGSGEQKKELRSMQNSGKHILSLLENLLEFSSLEQGTLQVSNSSFNLMELCKEVVGMFEPLARQKDLLFKNDFTFDSRLTVCTDALKLKQIIINVLSNSIKYTVTGGVNFSGNYRDGNIYLSIKDTGVGIPQKQMDVLFKPFARATNSGMLAEGSGFGMYVVKGLVELLKGKIFVTSAVGKGTQIDVVIPAEQVQVNTSAVSIKNLLAIDDDLPTLGMLSCMLLRLGHSVTTCNTMDEFERHVEELVHYDMVITDMEMGVISGSDILRKVRSVKADIPVVVMTGRSDFSNVKASEDGFNGYLPKAVTMSSLSRLVGNPAGYACNMEQFEEMFDNDVEAMRNVLELFVTTTAENVATLHKTVSQDDFRSAQAICHKMLPMFMQLGADDAVEILKKMDTLRSVGAEQYPEWKEAIVILTNKAEILVTLIQKRYLNG